MIFIQQLRTNDISPDSGKQYELGKAFMSKFGWNLDPDNSEHNVLLHMPDCNVSTRFKVRGNERGGSREGVDCKEYADANGSFPLKDYLRKKFSSKHVKNVCLVFEYVGDNEFNIEFTPLVTNVEIEDTKLNNQDETHEIQQIFYGAPGTGKSHEVKKITGELEGDKPNVFRTTFHPDTDYASFVGCYKPVMKQVKKSIVKPHEQGQLVVTEQSDEIAYEFVPQAFTDAYIYAYDHPEETTYLVIEEINRGNCAQIFGDLFQLLDRDENGISDYSIKADKDLAKYLNDYLKNKDGIKDGKLSLTANLHILATMNTSDQSLFPIDSAFKRRWDWEYVPIDYAEEKSSKFEINIDSTHSYSWVDFIKEVNKRIFDVTQSEDKQMGNFFIKGSVNQKQFCSKVMFYLWNEVLKDEVENAKYFFYQKIDGNDVKFTFTDIYGNNNDETLLVNFMKYLGVEKIKKDKNKEESSSDPEQGVQNEGDAQ